MLRDCATPIMGCSMPATGDCLCLNLKEEQPPPSVRKMRLTISYDFPFNSTSVLRHIDPVFMKAWNISVENRLFKRSSKLSHSFGCAAYNTPPNSPSSALSTLSSAKK